MELGCVYDLRDSKFDAAYWVQSIWKVKAQPSILPTDLTGLEVLRKQVTSPIGAINSISEAKFQKFTETDRADQLYTTSILKSTEDKNQTSSPRWCQTSSASFWAKTAQEGHSAFCSEQCHKATHIS